MLTLSLLRHAKSSWSDPRLKDIERPLNERGERDAPRMGAFMARQGLVPGLVLCSPAVRTRQTVDLALRRLTKASPEVAYEDALYLAAPGAMLTRLRKVAARVQHVLLVGHNPGLQALAVGLAGEGAATDLTALAEKLPTAGLVALEFDTTSWARVKAGGGRLRLFMTPKRLK